jgi:hypothetical protein
MTDRVVIVTGSRHWENQRLVWQALDQHKPDLVVHGGCETGADEHADRWAKRRQVDTRTFRAKWGERYEIDRSAGPRRNRKMLEAYPSAIVLAFPQGGPGTADCMSQARELRMHVEIIRGIR